MELNKYVEKVHKYGLTPGFEKLDIKEIVDNLKSEVDVLRNSLDQPGKLIKDNKLISKNLANLFIVMCHVAERYNINLEAAVMKKLEKERRIESPKI